MAELDAVESEAAARDIQRPAGGPSAPIYEPGTQPEDIDTTALTTLAAFAVSENRGAAKGRARGASVREGALCR